MDISNSIYKLSNSKKELIEKLNFKQQEIKNLPKKSMNNKYLMNIKDKICNGIKNGRRRKNNEKNLLKKVKMIKYFISNLKTNNLLLINCIIFINLLIPIYSEKFGIRKNSFSNEITIKLISNDTQNILYENFIYPPDEVLIEGDSYLIDEKNRINLTNDVNYITMRWNSELTNFTYMFADLSNLKEIDLSNFDISGVTRMSSMFQNCYNLELYKI